jgi:hypothetical protein
MTNKHGECQLLFAWEILTGKKARSMGNLLFEVSFMKFIDDLYNMYKDHLTGDEEDAIIIVSGIFDDFDRDALLDLVHEMDDSKLEEMVIFYIFELLRRKMADEGLGHVTMNTDPTGRIIH